jgi:hypothetical protein
MEQKITQKQLFDPLELSIQNKPVKIELNNHPAFGITQTGLCEGRTHGALETIFRGIRNLRIPIEMLRLQNPAEILAEFFAAGHLKWLDKYPSLNPNIPRNFFELINGINKYSDKNGFACLKNNFEEYFDIEQGIRLALLKQSMREGFVESFLADYEEPLYNPNCDGRDKEIYAQWIHRELKNLGESAKEL